MEGGQGWQAFPCFSAADPLGLLSSLCLRCILRLRHTIKWLGWREFSCLIQCIYISLYLRSHFPAFYVSTPLNVKVYRNFHVLVHFSHFRLVFSTLSLLHYTFPLHQFSRLTIMFISKYGLAIRGFIISSLVFYCILRLHDKKCQPWQKWNVCYTV